MKIYKVILEVLIETDGLDIDNDIALTNSRGDMFYPLLGFEIDKNIIDSWYTPSTSAISDEQLEAIGITVVEYKTISIQEIEDSTDIDVYPQVTL